MTKKKKKTKKSVMSVKQINLTMYTEESYKKCFPDAEEGDYENKIDIPISNIIKQFESNNNIHMENIRCVPIDDFYFEVIKENGLEDSPETRINYMASLSDKEVELLWNSSELSEYIHISVIPVHICNKTHDMVGNIKLGKKCVHKVKNTLQKYYGVDDEDVFVLDKLYRADFLHAIEDQVENNILAGLCGEKTKRYDNKYLEEEMERSILKQRLKTDNSAVVIQTKFLVFGAVEKIRWRYTRKQALNNDLGIKDGDLEGSVANKLKDILKKEVAATTKNEELFLTPIAEEIQNMEDFCHYIQTSLEHEINSRL